MNQPTDQLPPPAPETPDASSQTTAQVVGVQRRDRETAKAFQAFTIYCGLGTGRSLRLLSERMGKGLSILNRWSSVWEWKERVLAHDDAMMALERATSEAVARAKGVHWGERYHELRAEEWRSRMLLVKLAGTILERWLASPEYKMGTLEGLARLYDLASILGRRACEQASDRHEVTGDGGGPIRVEFEKALSRIYCGTTPSELRRLENVVEAELVPVPAAKAPPVVGNWGPG